MSKVTDPSALDATRFVSNYPPFAHWSAEAVASAEEILDRAPDGHEPMGLYLHIPFCRKRCHFCYFRVFTGRSSEDITRYVTALQRELDLISRWAAVGGRGPRFVYFGGGTPSYLSSSQLETIFEAARASFDDGSVEEVTFECEPGTLSKSKVRLLKDLGVTRLSLGVEHFDDRVLEWNGRAHREAEIHRAMEWISDAGFSQVNLDLIAGLVGDTDELWSSTLDRTLAADPDSVTIYSLEIPPNTTLHREIRTSGHLVAPLPDAESRRRGLRLGFDRFMEHGYGVSSAYTLAREGSRFVYRDALWGGADMLGAGVSAFSQVGGVHYQNHSGWDPYVEAIEAENRPLARAYAMDEDERLVREVVLQLKRGRLDRARFLERHRVDIHRRFEAALGVLVDRGLANVSDAGVRLTLDGLLGVDALLPLFFRPEHRD